VVATQLAIFPLPWGCSVRTGLAALMVLLVPALLGDRPPDMALRNALWLLALILAPLLPGPVTRNCAC